MTSQKEFSLKNIEITINIIIKSREARLLAEALSPDEKIISPVKSRLAYNSKSLSYKVTCSNGEKCIKGIRSVIDDFLRCLKPITDLLNEKST
ncbi:MAG TPA: hypothetical protein ENG54_00230 [Thermofilum sp.]|nr:hypothetical protein [Thermofilum sp.]